MNYLNLVERIRRPYLSAKVLSVLSERLFGMPKAADGLRWHRDNRPVARVWPNWRPQKPGQTYELWRAHTARGTCVVLTAKAPGLWIGVDAVWEGEGG